MAVEIKSKRAVVSTPPYQLYMAFTDMRNFLQYLPEDKREGVQADYDSIRATVQGFEIGVKIKERTPYSKIEFVDDGAPFHFTLTMHFDPSTDPYKTDFQIVVDADLNFMMRAGCRRVSILPCILRDLASDDKRKLQNISGRGDRA